MKQFRFEKKGGMYVQATLERKKTTRSLLEVGGDEVAREMNQKDTVNDRKPAASSNLSEEMWTAMRKVVKANALLSSIYEVEIRKMARSTSLAPKMF